MASRSPSAMPGVGDRPLNDRNDRGDVLAGGHLGNHATVGRVHQDLRCHHVSKNATAVLDDRGGGLVAGGLNPEDQHLSELPEPVDDRPQLAGELTMGLELQIALVRAAGVGHLAGVLVDAPDDDVSVGPLRVELDGALRRRQRLAPAIAVDSAWARKPFASAEPGLASRAAVQAASASFIRAS